MKGALPNTHLFSSALLGIIGPSPNRDAPASHSGRMREASRKLAALYLPPNKSCNVSIEEG